MPTAIPYRDRSTPTSNYGGAPTTTNYNPATTTHNTSSYNTIHGSSGWMTSSPPLAPFTITNTNIMNGGYYDAPPWLTFPPGLDEACYEFSSPPPPPHQPPHSQPPCSPQLQPGYQQQQPYSSHQQQWMSPTAMLGRELEYGSKFEQDYCKDFTCCGLALPDLHELLSHFEDAHVVVLAPDGTPLPPPDSARSSPCLPSGSTISPATPCLPPASTTRLPAPQTQSICTTSAMGVKSEDVPAFLTSVLASPTLYPPPPPAPSSQKQPRPQQQHRQPQQQQPLLPPVKSEGLPPTSFSKPFTPSPSPPRRHHPYAKEGKRLKCPNEGCTKTYRQLNGLKYHLSKGTCVDR